MTQAQADQQPPICIFHGFCDDGFGAAWSMREGLGHDTPIQFHLGVYGEAPPPCLGRDVFILDFSYPREVMERIADAARRVVVLDHHKTAEADLAELLEAGIVEGEFDMDRSGAMMAWQYFNPDKPAPWLIAHIQDRDLWRKQLPSNDQVIMALRSYPQDFDVWDQIVEAGPSPLIADGNALRRWYLKAVEDLKANVIRQVIGGFEVPVVNAPYLFASELAGDLAEGEPFGACYWDGPKGTTYSLRSRDGGVDVSEVAKEYGGGGHRNAADFRVQTSLG